MGTDQYAVDFPLSGEGRRSTSAVGRSVVADALRAADPTGALDAEQETNWRSGYLLHFRRLVEAGLASRAACLSIADAGLASLHGRMTVADEAGDERPLAEWAASDPAHPLETVEVTGTAARERELSLPFKGERLRGDALRERLDAWLTAGVMEPSAADAVRTVLANPDWLALEGRTSRRPRCRRRDGTAPGAAAVGRAGCRCRPAPTRALGTAPPDRIGRSRHAARAHVGRAALRRLSSSEPVRTSSPAYPPWPAGSPSCLDRSSSATTSTPTVAPTSGSRWRWTRSPSGSRTSATTSRWPSSPRRPTCSRSRVRLLSRPPAATSTGPVRRSWSPGRCAPSPVVACCVAPMCGRRPGHQRQPRSAAGTQLRPGQAAAAVAGERCSRRRRHGLAQRRAAHPHPVGRQEPRPGRRLRRSPPLRRRGLRARHRQRADGRAPRPRPAHRGGPAHDHPWQDEAYGAVHGGLWRAAYAPRSALGLAALLGYGAARG